MATLKSISHQSLRYINAISFRIAPLSTSRYTRSLRLLLATIPSKASRTLPEVPKTTLVTVPDANEQRIDITYSDKKTQSFPFSDLNVADLIRKIEAPAKVIRAKEEGL